MVTFCFNIQKSGSTFLLDYDNDNAAQVFCSQSIWQAEFEEYQLSEKLRKDSI